MKLGLEPKSTMLGGWDWVASGSPGSPFECQKHRWISGGFADTFVPPTDGHTVDFQVDSSADGGNFSIQAADENCPEDPNVRNIGWWKHSHLCRCSLVPFHFYPLFAYFRCLCKIKNSTLLLNRCFHGSITIFHRVFIRATIIDAG